MAALEAAEIALAVAARAHRVGPAHRAGSHAAAIVLERIGVDRAAPAAGERRSVLGVLAAAGIVAAVRILRAGGTGGEPGAPGPGLIGARIERRSLHLEEAGAANVEYLLRIREVVGGLINPRAGQGGDPRHDGRTGRAFGADAGNRAADR